MPTHEETPTFLRDYGRLTNTQEKRLEAALSQFIADLRAIEAGEQAWFRPGLRVKRVRGVAGLYEMTWAPDGRATFSMGPTPQSRDTTRRVASLRRPQHPP